MPSKSSVSALRTGSLGPEVVRRKAHPHFGVEEGERGGGASVRSHRGAGEKVHEDGVDGVGDEEAEAGKDTNWLHLRPTRFTPRRHRKEGL